MKIGNFPVKGKNEVDLVSPWPSFFLFIFRSIVKYEDWPNVPWYIWPALIVETSLDTHNTNDIMWRYILLRRLQFGRQNVNKIRHENSSIMPRLFMGSVWLSVAPQVSLPFFTNRWLRNLSLACDNYIQAQRVEAKPFLRATEVSPFL